MSRTLIIPAAKVIKTDNVYSVKLPDSEREKLQTIFELCDRKHNGQIRISLSPPGRPRSVGKGSQSAHVHGHIRSIAMATGQPFEDVKKYIKAAAVTQGYPILSDKQGKPILDLWEKVQGISESDATIEQCSLLIAQAHQLAAELGCALIEEEEEESHSTTLIA